MGTSLRVSVSHILARVQSSTHQIGMHDRPPYLAARVRLANDAVSEIVRAGIRVNRGCNGENLVTKQASLPND